MACRQGKEKGDTLHEREEGSTVESGGASLAAVARDGSGRGEEEGGGVGGGGAGDAPGAGSSWPWRQRAAALGLQVAQAAADALGADHGSAVAASAGHREESGGSLPEFGAGGESAGGDAAQLDPGRDVVPQGGALGASAPGDGDLDGLGGAGGGSGGRAHGTPSGGAFLRPG